MANEQNLETVCKNIFGITSRQYRYLANDGKVPPVVSGKIDFLQATKQLMEYYRKMAAGQGSLSLTDERCRLTKINADRKELQLEKERGELLHVDIVTKLLGAMCQNIRNKVLAIPSKLAPLVTGIETIPESEEILRKNLYDVLTEISQPDFRRIARMAGDKPDSKNSKTSSKTKGKRMGRQRKNPKP